MANVEFEITSHDGVMTEANLDAVKTVNRMIGGLQQSWQAGAAILEDFF